ncbi:MAG: hypothetical protein WCS20_05900 [Alphaproteobacteria bacterium]
MIKQIGLAVGLIALPVALFAAAEYWLVPHEAAALAGPSLGDLTPLKTIVTDVQAIVAKGDLSAAAARITDLETAWDDAEGTMRPLNPVAWGGVDGLIDTSLRSLRTANPDASAVTGALLALQTGLDNPSGSVGTGGIQMVQGIAVTDEAGHFLPCETMISAVRAKPQDSISASDKASVTDLLTKATERCNADDDGHANTFSAAALAILAK